MNLISILCVYNDRKTLDELLRPGLQRQTVAWEEVFVDNAGGGYTSAAAALNAAGARAKGDYLMIVHQDVAIGDDAFLEKAEAALTALGPFGAAGVAGCGPDSEATKTAILCGTPPRRPGELLSEPTEVQTLDECLFFIPREVFAVLPFDADTCDDWHLYAVDYCLVARARGLKVYAVPFAVYHKSAGVVSRTYFETLSKVLEKHKATTQRICTTVGVWKTDFPRLRAAYYRLKMWAYLARHRGRAS